jgi:hypothetical protein
VETPSGGSRLLHDRLGGVLGGRRQQGGKRAHTARPDENAALLIPRELLGVDEFLFEGFERFVIQLELDLECPICHTLTLLEEGNHLIEDGVKVHRGSSCTCGRKYGPAAARGHKREATCYMYCKEPAKESRKEGVRDAKAPLLLP